MRDCQRCGEKACGKNSHDFFNEFEHKGTVIPIEVEIVLHGVSLCHKCMCWLFGTAKETE